MRPLLALLLVLLAALPAAAERRVALVIGNAAYEAAPRLANPARDADALARALEALGFEVTARQDLGIDAMRAAIRDYGRAAAGADTALFFYAGHGIQVGGRNYLLPVDAVLAEEGDLDFAAIPLDLVLAQTDRTGADAVVLLDACRDNPFETRLSRSMGATRSAALMAPGLAEVETVQSALVGFATQPGAVAFDGAGRHSPFTAALLEHLPTPGLEINALMTRVRADVVAATGERQRPWTTSALLREVYLAPPEGETRTAARAPEREPDRPLLRLVTPDRAAPRRACPACPETVLVPGGETVLGTDAPEAEAAEGPPVAQRIAPFRMATTEITVAEIRRFEAETGREVPPGCFIWTRDGRLRFNRGASWERPGYPVTDESPAACLSWEDARAYADWLSAQVEGPGFRLPSEAEFEYAAEAGGAGGHPWEGGAAAACGAVNGADAGARFPWRNAACEDGWPETAPAGALPANGFGLHETTGNLWEWTADCFNPTNAGAPADGSARLTGLCESRIVRGASWDDPLENLRTTYRVGIPADRRQANVGFRLVRDAAEGDGG